MKVGLFGGSFDPIHLGHLRCAEELAELFRLDEVVFIPAARQPLKSKQDVLPFHHRSAMVKIAIAGNPHFSVSEKENERTGPSYSIDTVNECIREYSVNTGLYFIMGQDAFQDITLWKAWQELLQRCHIIVMTRPGFDGKTLQEILPAGVLSEFGFDSDEECYRGNRGGAIFFRRITRLEISSTDIRSRRAAGRSIRYLVPDAVASYIEAAALYSRHPSK